MLENQFTQAVDAINNASLPQPIQTDKFDVYRSGSASTESSNRTITNGLLPNLQLHGEDFSGTAQEAFKYVDTNHDGVLTKKELNHAESFPVRGEPSEAIAAVKIMDKQFDFLANASPNNSNITGDVYGITSKGIDIAQKVIDGENPDIPLSHLGRYTGAQVGYVSGAYTTLAAGVSAGISLALDAAEGTIIVSSGAALAGSLAVGLVAPTVAAMAVGYGIGYAVDKVHQHFEQKAEISSFRSEFQ